MFANMKAGVAALQNIETLETFHPAASNNAFLLLRTWF